MNAGFTDIDSADVILASDDQILFLAHRCVLCPTSLVLKYLLLNNFSPTYVIRNTIDGTEISEVHSKFIATMRQEIKVIVRNREIVNMKVLNIPVTSVSTIQNNKSVLRNGKNKKMEG